MSWDRQTARKLIKNHVKNRGDQPIVLTDRLVRYWYTALNIAVFNGILPQLADVFFVRHKKAFAWAHGKEKGRTALSFQPKFASRTLFLKVLVHEMVHVWEHFNDRQMTHGPQFHKWKGPILRRTTLPLETKLDDIH